MAEETLKKLDQQLICSICLDTYTDPKLLQCFHGYCQQCLVSLVVHQGGEVYLHCPECQQLTPIIPTRGVKSLQSAFHIKQQLEMQESFKRISNKSASCPLTPSEDMKIKANSTLEPLEKQATLLEKTLRNLDTHCEKIPSQQAAIKENIQVTFTQLREILSARETELKDQLDKMVQGKLQGLEAQRNWIKTTLVQLNTCLQFVEESLKVSKQEGVEILKTNTATQVKELTTSFQSAFLNCPIEDAFTFSAPTNMTVACQNYGQILASGLPDPSKSYMAGKGIETAVEGETSTAILQLVDFDGKLGVNSNVSLECEFVSISKKIAISCNVERGEQSKYKISYQPAIKGRHQLHVKVYGQHISGSPFSVTVVQNSPVLYPPTLTMGPVEGPHGVAIGQKGDVVVTEWGQHSVSVFSPKGEKLRSFGEHGSDEGQFRHPRGVAVDGDGNILVADSGNCCIQKFSPDGQFLERVGTEGSGPLKFAYPSDITFNPSNNKLYVVDNNNHCVQVLNSDLTFSSTFGKRGTDEGQFSSPHGIACDSTGKVYVADSYNHRIQVFTAEGEFLRMFGKTGRGKGALDLPYCVAVASDGLVYVSECCGNCISVFTSQGQFRRSFGSRGGRPGEFDRPCGLAIDQRGVVYVCDCKNHCVQLF